MLNSYLAPAIAEAITIKRAHSVRRTGDRVCFLVGPFDGVYWFSVAAFRSHVTAVTSSEWDPNICATCPVSRLKMPMDPRLRGDSEKASVGWPTRFCYMATMQIDFVKRSYGWHESVNRVF